MKRTFKSLFCTITLICLVMVSCKDKQPVSKSLPRSTPEAEGVSSEAIITFLDSAAVSVHEFHSFMFLRHGKVIAEGWWDPLGPDLKHTLYSTSKSFTATAIGLAENENRLSLDDKVISFFPESLPDTVSPYLEELSIRHLLSMSVGQGWDRSAPVSYTTDDWAKAFLAIPMAHKPGTTYMYNSMASYMLSAIVQKVTGEKVIDYLTPRLFEPLGIEGADWETCSDGINTGGWGLRLKTEDLAKFGQLYIDKGQWNGKQVLPETWVEEATSLKIYQNPELSDEEREASDDSVQGYCYQFWRARNNSYMANGAFGQFVLVIPEKDAVIVFTAESQEMWAELDMAWKYLVPGIKDEKLPEDIETYNTLKNRLASLALPVPPAKKNDALASQISGKTITLAENPSGMQSITLQFDDDLCLATLKTDTASYDISFASGKWYKGETRRHAPSIFAIAQNSLGGLPPFKIAGAYSWIDDNTLELVLRYIDAMHTERIKINFDGSKVKVDIVSSIGRGNMPSIEGTI